jgi:hypothetical protein
MAEKDLKKKKKDRGEMAGKQASCKSTVSPLRL